MKQQKKARRQEPEQEADQQEESKYANPWGGVGLAEHLSHHHQRLIALSCLVGNEMVGEEVFEGLLFEEAIRAGLIEELVEERWKQARVAAELMGRLPPEEAKALQKFVEREGHNIVPLDNARRKRSRRRVA